MKEVSNNGIESSDGKKIKISKNKTLPRTQMQINMRIWANVPNETSVVHLRGNFALILIFCLSDVKYRQHRSYSDKERVISEVHAGANPFYVIVRL